MDDVMTMNQVVRLFQTPTAWGLTVTKHDVLLFDGKDLVLYCIDYGLPYEPGLPLWQEGVETAG